MNSSMKQKQSHRHTEQIFGCQEGKEWRRDGLGVGINRCKLLSIEWINKILLYSTGNIASNFVKEKEPLKIV